MEEGWGKSAHIVRSDIEQNEYRRLKLAPKDIIILEFI